MRRTASAEFAETLDQYPSLAVDTAARVPKLLHQPCDGVRAFILKYQDRILYGLDLHSMQVRLIPACLILGKKQWARDWRSFATGHTFKYLGHKIGVESSPLSTGEAVS